MKKVCFWLAVTFLLVACHKNHTPGIHIPGTGQAYQPVFRVDSGWDIYTGGVYRYGPSIIRNTDGSIDAWFAAPGSTFGKKQLLFNESGAQSPIPLSGSITAAQQFSAAEPFYAVAVGCPNWTTTNSSLTMTLYEWKTDYATTVNGTPLAQHVYTNYQDNENLQLARTGKFAAGTYLWVLSEPSGSAGVWEKAGETGSVQNYLNGAAVTGSYQSFLMIDSSSGAAFWDQIAYRRSTDEGKTWTADTMVLQPTEGTRDQLSVCDPGVVKFGGYYYIGYTSTENAAGIFNHVYMARSASPTGPWDKWNGSGWGGNPQPVITFDGATNAWGAGEPCMVVNNDTLFLYYTWDNSATLETRVATASAKDANWPAHLVLHGTAVDKTGIAGADHCDVKYRPDIRKYYALHTAARLTANSYIILWESSDGLSFHKIAELRDNLKLYLHNCGWSGDSRGHSSPLIKQYLSYAYGPSWANWNTAWHPIVFQPADSIQ